MKIVSTKVRHCPSEAYLCNFAISLKNYEMDGYPGPVNSVAQKPSVYPVFFSYHLR